MKQWKVNVKANLIQYQYNKLEWDGLSKSLFLNYESRILDDYIKLNIDIKSKFLSKCFSWRKVNASQRKWCQSSYDKKEI